MGNINTHGSRGFARSAWTSKHGRGFPLLVLLLSPLVLAFWGCERLEFDNVPVSLSLRCRYTPRDIRTFPHPTRRYQLVFGDYNGDGRDEAVDILNVERSKKSLSLLELRGHDFKAVKGFSSSGFFQLAGFADADSDRNAEVFFTLERGDTLVTGFLPFERKRGYLFLLGTKSEFVGDHAGRCSLRDPAVLPNFRQGDCVLYSAIITPWTDAPRYVVLFSIPHETRLDIPMGGMPITHCVADVNGDGHQELLVGTYAPANGAEANGMDDSQAWLVVISDSGKILHKQVMGGFGGKVFLSPWPVFSPNGPPSILLAQASYATRTETPDYVARWSWKSRNQFKKLAFQEGLVDRMPLFYHDPYTGTQHIVVLTRTGYLVDVDENLRILRARKAGFLKNPSEADLTLVEDFRGDRRPELVVSNRDFSFVLSADFRLLALVRGRPLRHAFHVGKDRHPLFCYIDANGKIYHFTRLEINPVYVGARVGALLVVLLFTVVLPLSIRRARHRATHERMARTNAFRAWALEAMDTGTVIFDAAGKLVSINRKAREMLGLPGEVSGTLNGFSKELSRAGLDHIANVLRKLDKHEGGKVETELTLRRGGTTQLWLVSAELLRDREGRVVGKAVALRDVTETVRSQQIMSWVALARRLAHEVKTPIASILLAAEKIQRLLKHVPEKDKNRLQTYFDLMFREIERTRDLAETMMQVTDLERNKREPVDVNAVVREAVELLAPQSGPGIDIELDLAENLPSVLGSRAQIALAVTNVLKNAIQAIENEGSVHLRTFVARGLQGQCRSDGAYVAIEIADSGEGIPEETQDKIFEPYFSRKHSGTGLGLAIVKAVLDDHQGCVEFESAPGVGTTFWLYFPTDSEPFRPESGEKPA